MGRKRSLYLKAICHKERNDAQQLSELLSSTRGTGAGNSKNGDKRPTRVHCRCEDGIALIIQSFSAMYIQIEKIE
jgi:hypothetical protein